MSSRRSALGRGLGALISSDPQASAPDAPDATPSRPAEEGTADAVAVMLPVDKIVPNPEQPRRVFDPEQLERLTQSIARHGVLQPVVVRSAASGYELVVGERRWRASQAAGLREIPAVVSDLATADRLEVAIIENVQRHDLNPIELAHAYDALASAGATQQQIGERVGLDRSSVANHLRLLELPLELQSDVEGGRISMGHAKALLQVNGPERQRHLRDRVIAEQLSVRDTERIAREASPGRSRPKAGKPAKPAASEGAATPDALLPLAHQLRDQLQTQVRIVGDEKQGRIELQYFSGEDLERLVSAILDGR